MTNEALTKHLEGNDRKLDCFRTEVRSEFRELGSRVDGLSDTVSRYTTRLDDFRDWFRPDYAATKERVCSLEETVAVGRGRNAVIFTVRGILGSAIVGGIVTLCIRIFS